MMTELACEHGDSAAAPEVLRDPALSRQLRAASVNIPPTPRSTSVARTLHPARLWVRERKATGP